MTRLWIAAVCALLLLTPAFASAPDHMASYREFLAAQQRGDVEAALVHGEAAWQAAETTLGAHPTTAMLAYNYARLAGYYAETTEQAFAAYERTLALTRTPVEGIDPLLLQIGRDELALQLGTDAAAAARSLHRTLIAYAEAGHPASDLSAQGWATLAEYQLAQAQRESARTSALQAAAHAQATVPANSRILAEALTTAAIADLSSPAKGDNAQRLNRAVADLERAIELFPAQASLDEFDLRLARALLWRQAAVTISSSVERAAKRRRHATPKAVKPYPISSKVGRRQVADPESCPTLDSYMVKTKLKYPRQALRMGNIGAVLFGFEIEGTRISRVRILAENQGAGFGEMVEQMLAEWALREPYPERCMNSYYLTTALFSF